MKFGILKACQNSGLDDEIMLQFVAPMTIVSNQPAYSQDMVNLKRKVRSQNVQRWELETNLEPESYFSSFLVHSVNNGHYTPVCIRMPQNSLLNYTTATDITVNGTFNKNTSIININNAQNLVAGEFINFGDHRKVYLVTDGGAGGMGIKIQPALQKTVFDLTPIKTGGNVTLVAYYDPTVRLGITYIDGIIADPGNLKFSEALDAQISVGNGLG
jgi:hypothetical protein